MAHKKSHHKKRHHSSSAHMEYTPHHSPSVSRDVVDMGGQRGHMKQGEARHENAFGNMSTSPHDIAGFPRGVRMEEYPSVGVFLSLDDNLGGSREGIDRQMMEDSRQLHKQIRPRKI